MKMYINDKIVKWAKEKNLIHPDNAKTQLLKSFEEMGELAEGILKDDFELITDAIGDVMVTLIILAKIKGTNIDTCLHYAWHQIKDRKGTTVDGTFIKDTSGDVAEKKDDSIRILQKETRNYMKRHGLKFSKLNTGEQYNPFPISYSTLIRLLGKGEISLKMQVLLSEFFGYEHQFEIKKVDKDGNN